MCAVLYNNKALGSGVNAESTCNNAYLSQRAVYDERYKAGDYDRRSAVRVLTAEREALDRAVERALKSKPNFVEDQPIRFWLRYRACY